MYHLFHLHQKCPFFDKKLCSHFFYPLFIFQSIMLTTLFFKVFFKSSPWVLKMDIYKCPKSKTKSRIYFYIVIQKYLYYLLVIFKSIYGNITKILIKSMFFHFLGQNKYYKKLNDFMIEHGIELHIIYSRFKLEK